MSEIALRSFCHSRSGDKGNHATLSLIVFRESDFPIIAAEVTAEKVAEYFGDLLEGQVDRFELPQVGALAFYLHDVLRGGATQALHRDIHGKALSGAFLDMKVKVPESFVPPMGPF